MPMRITGCGLNKLKILREFVLLEWFYGITTGITILLADSMTKVSPLNIVRTLVY